jgi:hypothetical protein
LAQLGARSLEAIHSNSERVIIPVISYHMVPRHASTAGRNVEYLAPELQSYFITPDGARAGQAAEKLTFVEAVNRMIF